MTYEKERCNKAQVMGRLKKKAHNFYEIRPSENNVFYEIWRKSDVFDFVRKKGLLELDEAVERIEELREKKFWDLCNMALYQRRLEKCRNL